MAARQDINDLLENIRAELPSRAHTLFEEAVQRASEGQRQGRRRVEYEYRQRSPWERQRRHYQEQEGILAIFALVIGFIGGVAVMYLFDPERGERRRALLREQANQAISEAEDAAQHVRSEVDQVANSAADSVKDTANRVRGDVDKTADQAADSLKDTSNQVRDQASKTATSASQSVSNAASSASSSVKDATSQVSKAASGVSAEVSKTASSASDSLKDVGNQIKSAASDVKQRAENASLSDVTLLARVRAEVARDVRSPGLVEVEVKDGTVSLTGKIRAGEVQTLVEKITALPGVRSVDNRLEIHDAIENTSSPSNPTSNGTA